MKKICFDLRRKLTHPAAPYVQCIQIDTNISANNFSQMLTQRFVNSATRQYTVDVREYVQLNRTGSTAGGKITRAKPNRLLRTYCA